MGDVTTQTACCSVPLALAAQPCDCGPERACECCDCRAVEQDAATTDAWICC